MKLKEAVKLYLEQTIKATTRKTHSYALKHLNAVLGPDQPITQIAPADVARWNGVLIARPDITEATRNRYRTSVRAFFNWLVNMDELDKSPARNMKIKREKAVPRNKAMPDKKLFKLLDFLQWKPRHRDYALVLFLADTGCRIGEAASLTVDNLDLENNRAWVSGKTDGRMVPFGNKTARIIKQWLLQRREVGPYVFSETIKPQEQLDQEFRRNCMRAGIGSWGPHSLRHRKAFQYADSGAEDAAILAQSQLGHSDISMTLNRYFPHSFHRVTRVADTLAIPDDEQPIKPNFRHG